MANTLRSQGIIFMLAISPPIVEFLGFVNPAAREALDKAIDLNRYWGQEARKIFIQKTRLGW